MRAISSFAMFVIIAGAIGLGLMIAFAATWRTEAMFYAATIPLGLGAGIIISRRFARRHPELEAVDWRSTAIPLLAKLWLAGSLCCFIVFLAVLQGAVMGPGDDDVLFIPAFIELVLTVGIALGVVEEARNFL